MLRKSYAIKGGPSAPETEDYLELCRREWSSLLAADPEEKAIQSFLEQNPLLLPGAWTPGTRSGHYPLHCAVVSQPELPGIKSKRPDFMWISTHSSHWYPTLIEIERPSKRIFKSSGIPTAEFTQARNQLAQWRTWFSRPENVQKFIASYGIPDWMANERQMTLHMILVYGRRSEFEGNPELSLQRASLMSGSDEELMSLDRLLPDRDLRDAVTIRARDNGRYKAVCIPPLFRLSPGLAPRLLAIDGVDHALSATPLISEMRRQFLISRIPYWKEWARNGRGGVISSGDSE
ncbi:MAG: hypothetical protein JWR69_489 [Pedosphaera sp.]|nr:hypothetical protein [Pedosphaera sp.]